MSIVNKTIEESANEIQTLEREINNIKSKIKDVQEELIEKDSEDLICFKTLQYSDTWHFLYSAQNTDLEYSSDNYPIQRVTVTEGYIVYSHKEKYFIKGTVYKGWLKGSLDATVKIFTYSRFLNEKRINELKDENLRAKENLTACEARKERAINSNTEFYNELKKLEGSLSELDTQIVNLGREYFSLKEVRDRINL